MSLVVTLTSGGTTYRVQTERIVAQITRPVVNIPLPANVPPILLDLGQKQPSFTLEGVVFDADTESEGGQFILGFLLAVNTIFGDWWNTDITLAFPNGHTATVKAQNLRLEMDSANTTYWNATLSFTVSIWA